MSRKLYVGMDVHKDTIGIAVFSSAGRLASEDLRALEHPGRHLFEEILPCTCPLVGGDALPNLAPLIGRRR
jgi:hypothetical protein